MKFTDTLEAITRNLTVDESWKSGDIRGLALSLRDLDVQEGPVHDAAAGPLRDACPARVRSTSSPAERARELWNAVETDKVGRYLKANPDDELPDPKDVS